MKTRLAVTLLTTLIATSAQAWQAGDVVVRAGAAGVMPTGDGTVYPAAGTTPAGKVEADDAWSLGVSLTYMATNNIGVGVLGAWPFKHDINGKDDLAAAGTVAETKQLPPTVTLQYHFDTGSNLHPYAGIGVNYTTFFDTKTKGALTGTDLDLGSSWGLAGELGVDYELQNNWLVGAQVFYMDIDTDAKISGAGAPLDGTHTVSIDPWAVMVSVGKKF
ncbi:MAG: OmpW family outer membrane protein [Pseudomonadota bacterium]